MAFGGSRNRNPAEARSSFARVLALVCLMLIFVGGAPIQAADKPQASDPLAKSEKSEITDLKAKAEQGDGDAQTRLGMIYSEGKGVPQNVPEGVKWYRMAAEHGNTIAEMNLAKIYLTGQGIRKDAAESLKWYRKAADQGVAGAQFLVGDAFYSGTSTLQDYTEAAKWYRRAADQGYAIAQVKLGLMCAQGIGAPSDLIEAHKWLNLAAAKAYPQAAQTRDKIAVGMSPLDIAEAQKRASAFRPGRTWGNDAPAPDTAEIAKGGNPKTLGTGFFISDDGYLLTNYHVVDGGSTVKVKTSQGLLLAKLVRADPANDLALVKVTGTFHALPVVSSRLAKLGETVFTVGFPNTDLQGFSPKLTKGEISSLSGVKDDPRRFQISVPVQPGNSGGPLVDKRGNVLGIVNSRLNDFAGLEAGGMLPQNVNYAVKGSFVTAFLETLPELSSTLKAAAPDGERDFETVVKEAQDAVAMVVVY